MILASASPRRRRLIAWLGIDAEMTATDTPEDLTRPLPPDRLAADIAADKARAARAAGARDALALAFDTVVVSDGRVLGKPADEREARRMLRALSGRGHHVVTGVALLAAGVEIPDTMSVTTRVAMRVLDDASIETWISRGEALGCAGAYNIEHHLASVSDDECYQNVAGLPLCHLYAELASGRAGSLPPGLTVPIAACDAALHRTCTLGPRVCRAGGGENEETPAPR